VGKDGILHVLDRESRENLWQTPVTTQKNRDVPLTTEGVHVCPGVLGGVEWNGPAFSPATNMLYVNAVDWCGTFSIADELSYVEGQFYMGGSVDLDSLEDARGWLTAVDASTGEPRWRYESSRPMLAAITATSGGVLFTGELTGDFLAIDAETGDVLCRFNTGGPLNGGISTYVIGGKQYVAAMSGDATSFWGEDPATSTALLFALP
jgi:alcohol dehydrogenase (cytochrome c)